MLEFIPDVQRLTSIFSQATAPTFFLGAVAAFVSLMSGRLSAVVSRIQRVNKITDEDQHVELRSDIDRLRRRARLLSRGIASSLLAGIFATVLLVILFASEFFGFKYAFGAGLLFVLASVTLGLGLVDFFREARLGLVQADELE